MAIRLYYYTY
ncbi:Cohesin subunit rad21, partial [Fusarium oxysporum f. sp. albedinis]